MNANVLSSGFVIGVIYSFKEGGENEVRYYFSGIILLETKCKKTPLPCWKQEMKTHRK